MGRLRLTRGTLIAAVVGLTFCPPTAGAFTGLPNDPWFVRQWNLSGPASINAPAAWTEANRSGRGGGAGVTVAVIDGGVAYENRGRLRRAPDLGRMKPGYDYVDGDRHPGDENGHGTHVAGTIAQATNNGVGTAGIAYNATIMPVRVLGPEGSGDPEDIAAGIRYAARHGAKVINMSIGSEPSARSSGAKAIVSAVRFARRRNVVMVASAGNDAGRRPPFLARLPGVLGVGATTADGCSAFYSDRGRDIDLVAPGGGDDIVAGASPYDQANCHPERVGPPIFQQSFVLPSGRFGVVGEVGTSMAAPHVAGVAALLIAARRGRVTAAQVESRLLATARDLGAPGFDPEYGGGLVDAAAALGKP